MAELGLPEELKVTKITELPLLSFVKLSACFGFSFGLVLGFGIFIISFFTDKLNINMSESAIVFDGFKAKGYEAGIIIFAILPLYFCFVFTLFSLPSFLPFRFILKKTRGFSVCNNEKKIKES